MTNEQIAIVLVIGTESDLIDLNDWAVNTVREYCRPLGYNTDVLVSDEAARIDCEGLNLEGYLNAVRTGSHYRLQRSVRRAVFAVIMTRRALRYLDGHCERTPREILEASGFPEGIDYEALILDRQADEYTE